MSKKVPRLALFATALAVPASVFVLRLVLLTTTGNNEGGLAGPWTLTVQPLFAGGTTAGAVRVPPTADAQADADGPPSPVCGPVVHDTPANATCARLGQSTKASAREACPAAFGASSSAVGVGP
jgi:hypothetical protein